MSGRVANAANTLPVKAHAIQARARTWSRIVICSDYAAMTSRVADATDAFTIHTLAIDALAGTWSGVVIRPHYAAMAGRVAHAPDAFTVGVFSANCGYSRTCGICCKGCHLLPPVPIGFCLWE